MVEHWKIVHGIVNYLTTFTSLNAYSRYPVDKTQHMVSLEGQVPGW